MKICSFLPSATEVLYALGADGDLAGVTFECDFPPQAAKHPVLVRPLVESTLSPQEIDDEVRRYAAEGNSLYLLDMDGLLAIQPDLIITQDLCKVCAVNGGDLEKAICGLASAPEVLSLTPHTLNDVFDDVVRVGKATGRIAEAERLVTGLRDRVKAVRQARRDAARPRVLCLEWLSPPFQGGHWIPEMVSLAGGDPVLATAGEKSVRLEWQQILEVDPEVLVVMPCGFGLDAAVSQYRETDFPPEWSNISAVRSGRVYAVDGNAYFSRPGPRLVDGLEILDAVVRESSFEDLPVKSVARL